VHTQAGDGRFRGVRRSASWDASDPIGDGSRICGRISIGGRTPGRMRCCAPRRARPSRDAGRYDPQLADVVEPVRPRWPRRLPISI